MQSNSNQTRNSDDINELMETFFKQAKTQFGSAIKSFWFYDGDLCPACSLNEIDTLKIKGKEAMSLNAFIHRESGTLIGYFLCASCAKRIFTDAQKHPYTQTALHTAIEKNLTAAYHDYLKKMKYG